jgi:hypothetical protein
VDKKLRLPKDGFIDEQDVEGHRKVPGDYVAPEGVVPRDDADKPHADAALEEDVEGHRIAASRSVEDFTILPAPPSITSRRTGSHGGE